MAQKINPISFRLGTTQVWNSTLQIYGKSFKNYFSIVNNQLNLQNFIIRYVKLNGFQINYYEWKMHKNKTFLSIYFSPSFNNGKLNLTNFKQLSNLLSNWCSNKFIFHFYLNSKWSLTSNFLTLYTKYLVEQKLGPKKIIVILCNFLQDQLNSSKVMHFKFGFIETKLVGFKIRLVGRFDSSNQMAKSFDQTIGTLSLTNLSSFVEYSNIEIHTKLGTCGVQVWLFFTPKKFINGYNQKNS
uniref:Small ribosomal subunit protein uS3m n=1 Tax=Chondrus crispus TaxID=2769 RepID=RT03_CHOCR|nr:ribosomal protein S3 [Chondrus crispus]P48938.1 RecName: Full=Small ribosomal subunit protein uS3m; AltName: Full=Ribosomal protein S3, mitochondrial [Chondrus crispus]CAA87601.1 ribosomal protein S3 [Chondrus crispus]